MPDKGERIRKKQLKQKGLSFIYQRHSFSFSTAKDGIMSWTRLINLSSVHDRKISPDRYPQSIHIPRLSIQAVAWLPFRNFGSIWNHNSTLKTKAHTWVLSPVRYPAGLPCPLRLGFPAFSPHHSVWGFPLSWPVVICTPCSWFAFWYCLSSFWYNRQVPPLSPVCSSCTCKSSAIISISKCHTVW